MQWPSYAYMGAQWGQQAGLDRDAYKQYGQLGYQNAQQASSMRQQRQQFQSQQAANAQRQKDSVFRFGVSALGGLLK